MNSPLKHITQHTTQVAFSTGVVASLVQGGCVVVGNDEDSEHAGVDAGLDEIVEQLEMDTLETASHAYHRPPQGSEPVIMPLELEDAPSSPPPRARPAPRRKARAQRKISRSDCLIEVSACDSPEPQADGPTISSEVAPMRRQPSKAKRRDPVGSSFVPGARSALQPLYGSGRF